MSNNGVTLDFSTAQPIGSPQQTAQPVQPSPTQSGNPVKLDFSTLQPIGSQPSVPPQPSEEQPGVLNRAWNAVKSEVAPIIDIGESVVTPPQDHKEELALTFGGPTALQAYRAARTVVGGVESAIKAPAEKYQQAKQDFQRATQDFQNKDYRNLASDAASTATDVMGAVSPGTSMVTDRAREFSEGARPGGDLVTPIVKTGVDVGLAALTDKVGEPSTPEEPGLTKQLIQGRAVNQPGTQAAIREGVQTASENAGTATAETAANIKTQPIMEGHTTVLDDHLLALQGQEAAAYKVQDDLAPGLKANRTKLINTNRAIDALTDTPEDVTKEAALEKSRTGLMDKIADSEDALKQAGVDPKAADVLHTQRMAGEDIKASIIKNTDLTDGSLNVKGLLNDAKKMRFTDYGDRLEQFFGSKQAADTYVTKLANMQKLGAHAVAARVVTALLAGVVGLGAWKGPAAVAGTMAALP